MSEIGLHKEAVDTPILWVELDRLERNIARLAGHFQKAGIQWRPHTKGMKAPALAHKLIDAGAIGITCAKLGEAEVMVAAGIKDILVANQIVGAQKIARLVNLRRHADVKVIVDSVENILEIGAAATEKGVTIGVLIEVNVGMDRAGVLPGEPTVALARQIAKTPGLALKGLQTWEGHTLTVTDPIEKRSAIEQSIARFTDTAQQCRDEGLPVEIVRVATVRDADGLALSSRNARLTPQARRLAPSFNRLLHAEAADRTIHDELVRAGFTVDYVETHAGRRFGAVLMDCGTHAVRLIDNVQLTVTC